MTYSVLIVERKTGLVVGVLQNNTCEADASRQAEFVGKHLGPGYNAQVMMTGQYKKGDTLTSAPAA